MKNKLLSIASLVILRDSFVVVPMVQLIVSKKQMKKTLIKKPEKWSYLHPPIGKTNQAEKYLGSKL